MANTFTSRIAESRTSAFTLPSPRKMPQQQEQQQQGQSSCEAGAGDQPSSTTTPLHFSSYEEFDNLNKSKSNSSRHNRSPSLPWLVEYMSSSFCRAPELVLDQLCSCSSTVDPTSSVYDISHTNTLNSTTTSNSIFSNNSNSISHHKINNNSKNSKKTATYFDDTILRSEPKVDRSPTKISPTRWEALRSVVASHGDYTIQDYCDFYEKAVESMPSEEKDDLNGIANTSATNNMNASYPSKDNLTKSLADQSKDEDEEDADVVMEDSISLRDDVPLSPIASGNMDSGVDIRPSKSHSGRNINTCHSFDQYIETTSRCLCSSREGLETPTTPANANAAPPLSAPTTRLPDRRRSRQATFQLSPRTLDFQRPANNRNGNTIPPSPAHSQADTYSTISLSQSFAREFDEDSDDVVTRSRSLLEDGRSIFLATEPLNFADHNSDPSRSPFRTRTTLSDNDNDSNNETIDANGHQDEKKEDLENAPSTPPRRISRKRANESTNDDAYRCLVRMSPDNYKHGKSNESDIGIGENQENSSNNNSDYCWWDNVGMKFPTSPSEQSHLLSASSSLLLPLHPHQRIIAPLLDDFEGAAANADHSGYSCFRQEPQRRRISVPDF